MNNNNAPHPHPAGPHRRNRTAFAPRLLRHVVLLLLTAVLMPLAARAQDVVVESALDRAEILVGEQCRLSVTVKANEGARVVWPQYNEADTLMAGVEVVRSGSCDTLPSPAKGRIMLQRDYVLTSFDSAIYALRPLEVNVDGRLYASRTKLGLKVSSIPVDTVHVDQYYPPFGVMESPFVWQADILLYALGAWLPLIVALLLLVRLTQARPMRHKVVIKPKTPPAREAREALKDWEHGVGAESSQTIKALYVALADTLRRYLSRRYGHDFTDRTTEEVLGSLSEDLPAEEMRLTAEVLRTADSVKFARYCPSQAIRERHYAAVLTIVEKTLDDVQEHPQTIVRYEAYGDRGQRIIRMTMAGAVVVCVLTAVGLVAYTLYMLFTYLV